MNNIDYKKKYEDLLNQLEHLRTRILITDERGAVCKFDVIMGTESIKVDEESCKTCYSSDSDFWEGIEYEYIRCKYD